MPIGNGIAVTAMQMLDVYMTLANDGVARTAAPRRRDDRRGRRRATSSRSARTHRVVSSATAAADAPDARRRRHRPAPAPRPRSPATRSAGKTGTARKPPYDCPASTWPRSSGSRRPRTRGSRRSSCSTSPGNGQIYGGEIAAPVFSRIMQYGPGGRAGAGIMRRAGTLNRAQSSRNRASRRRRARVRFEELLGDVDVLELRGDPRCRRLGDRARQPGGRTGGVLRLHPGRGDRRPRPRARRGRGRRGRAARRAPARRSGSPRPGSRASARPSARSRRGSTATRRARCACSA